MSVALIIEEDAQLGAEIANALSGAWEPLVVRRWEVGLAYLEHESIGVAIMDAGDGMKNLHALGHLTHSVPIIVFGGSGGRKEAMESGAYAYLAKPFDPHELVGLVRTASRRTSQAQMRLQRDRLSFGSLVLDPTVVDAFVDGAELELTPSEFRLLYTLASNQGQTLGRDALAEAISGRRHEASRVVDVHVKRVRGKLTARLPDCALIHSLPGLGYEFNPMSNAEVAARASAFEAEILPAIRDRPARELAKATGLSYRYCHAIKKGECVPHIRHWEALGGVKSTSNNAARDGRP
jgi:DNA-binding response OmpR family regulator